MERDRNLKIEKEENGGFESDLFLAKFLFLYKFWSSFFLHYSSIVQVFCAHLKLFKALSARIAKKSFWEPIKVLRKGQFSKRILMFSQRLTNWSELFGYQVSKFLITFLTDFWSIVSGKFFFQKLSFRKVQILRNTQCKIFSLWNSNFPHEAG